MKESRHCLKMTNLRTNSKYSVNLLCLILGSIFLILFICHINKSGSLNTFKRTSRGASTEEDKQNFLKSSEATYSRYVEKRKAFVHHNPESVIPWKVAYFYDYFLPAFSCPYIVTRVGKLSDGGKWVCGYELFEKSIQTQSPNPCIVYSFGINKESSFEAEILSETDCLIYGYDGSVDSMGPEVTLDLDETMQSKVQFSKTFLSYNNTKGRSTLHTILQENGHDWIDILKIDIEGDEFQVLENILKDFPEGLPFGQLLIEIHSGFDEKAFLQIYHLWEDLEGRGLRAFMNEINPSVCVHRHLKGFGYPTIWEYSFLNVKDKRNRIIA